MRKLVGAFCLLLVVTGSLAAALPALLYAARPRMYALHCENRDRPAMHCNGKCQRMRQIQAALRVHGPAVHEAPPTSPETHWFLETPPTVRLRAPTPDRRPDIPVSATTVILDPDTPPPRAT